MRVQPETHIVKDVMILRDVNKTKKSIIPSQSLHY